MSTAAERIYCAVGIPSTSHGQCSPSFSHGQRLPLLSAIPSRHRQSSCRPLFPPPPFPRRLVSFFEDSFQHARPRSFILSRPYHADKPSQCNCIRRFLSFSLSLGELVFDDHMTTATTTMFLYREGVPTTTTTTTIARHIMASQVLYPSLVPC
jgi:hypothetical protein